MSLNAWSSVSDVVWWSYWTFMGWRLAGEKITLGSGGGRRAWWIINSFYFLFSLLVSGTNMVWQLPALASTLCLSFLLELLPQDPSGTVSQHKLLLKLILVVVFYHNNRKGTNICSNIFKGYSLEQFCSKPGSLEDINNGSMLHRLKSEQWDPKRRGHNCWLTKKESSWRRLRRIVHSHTLGKMDAFLECWKLLKPTPGEIGNLKSY